VALYDIWPEMERVYSYNPGARMGVSLLKLSHMTNNIISHNIQHGSASPDISPGKYQMTKQTKVSQ